jgi:hypothetical protein
MKPPTISTRSIGRNHSDDMYMTTDISIDGVKHATTGPMLCGLNNTLVADLIVTTVTHLIVNTDAQKLHIEIFQHDPAAISLSSKLKFLLHALSHPLAGYNLIKNAAKWTITQTKQDRPLSISPFVAELLSTRKRIAEQTDKEEQEKKLARRNDTIINAQLACIMESDLKKCILNATELETSTCIYTVLVNNSHYDAFEYAAIQTIKLYLSDISPDVSLVRHQETNYPYKTRYQFQISWNI